MSPDITPNSREVIKAYLALLLDGRSEADAFFANDAKWWVAGDWDGGGTFEISQVRAIAEVSATWFETPMRLVIRRIIAEGDCVAVELQSDAIFRNGRPYNNNYVMIYEVRDGLIRSVREYLDTKQISEGLAAIGERHPALSMAVGRIG